MLRVYQVCHFPHHRSWIAYELSDLRGVDQMTFQFELGTPFKPFQQLMGVLPVASMEHIPAAYQVGYYPVSLT